MTALKAKHALSQHVVTASEESRLKDILDQVQTKRATHCAVFRDEEFRGLVKLQDILWVSPHRIFADLLPERQPPTVLESTSLDEVFSHMERHGVDALPVFKEKGGFVGAITHESLVEALVRQKDELLRETERMKSVIEADRKQLAVRAKRLEELYEASRDLLTILACSPMEDAVLQKGIEALVRLVQAKYGAVAIVDEKGTVERFIYTGLSPEEAKQIGKPPQGRGLLGALLREGRVIRLDDIAQDAHHEGFPLHHPTMKTLLGVPISSQGRAYGGIYLAEKIEGRPFTDEDEQLALTFANSLALAIDNAHLYAKERLARHRAEVLADIMRAATSSLDLRAVLETIVRRIVEVLGVERCTIYLPDERLERIADFVTWGVPEDRLPLLETLKGRRLTELPIARKLLDEGGPIVIADASESDLLPTELVRALGMKTTVCTLVKFQDRPIAALFLDVSESRDFAKEEIALVGSIASQAAVAIENARLYQQTKRRLEEMRGLYEIARVFTTTGDLSTICGRLTERIAQLGGAEKCVVTLYDARTGEIRAQPPGYGVPAERVETFHYQARGALREYWNLRTQGPFIANRIDDIPEPLRETARAFGVVNLLVVPMVTEHRIVGVIYVANKRGGFTSEDAHLVTIFAGQAATAMENARLVEELAASEAKYRQIFEGSVEGIYQSMPDGRLLTANPAMARMLGFDRVDELLNHRATEFYVRPEDRRWWREELEQKGAVVNREFQMRRRDGRVIWVRDSARVVRDAEGRVLYYEGTMLDITEEKEREEAVRKLSRAIEQAGDNVLITDKDGVIEYVNPAFEALTGYTSEEAIGRTPRILKSGQHEREFYESLWETILAGRVFRAEFINRKKDGELYVEEKTISPIRDADGRITHFISTGRDITERKRMEEALIRLQEQTGHLVGELSPERLFQGIIQAAETIVPADVVALSLLGPTGDLLQCVAAQGEQAEAVIGQEVALDRPTLCAQAIRERKPLMVGGPNGAPSVVDPVMEASGMRVGLSLPLIKGRHVLGALALWRKGGAFTEQERRLLDIFANYVAGLIESVKLYEQVHQAEMRYRELYNEAPDGYFTVSADGLVEEMNATMLGWLGYERDEVIGKRRFDELVASEWCQHSHCLPELVERQGHIENIELELLRKDGRRIPVRLNAIAIRYADGRTEGYRATVREISKEKELEAQLLQAQKLESLGTLVGGIAHDFNNMLTGILGYAQLLLREMEPTSPHYDKLQYIETLGERAATMIRQLLTFSREEVAEKRPLLLHPFLKEVVKLLKHTIPENIEISLTSASKDVLVLADPTQLQQVIMNLAINARDAMPEGGQLHIETGVEEPDESFYQSHPELAPGRYVRLTVSDTGVGIPPEIRPRIFDPFFTTKGVGKGTGLGLAVVYGIVRNHGGAIDVDSRVGEGTRFTIHLPVAESVEAYPESPPPEVERGTGTILLVEDEPVVLEFAQTALEHLGYRVLTARDGEEAIGVYRAHRGEIDVVILDIVMPKKGGGEAFRELKQMDPTVNVLFATAYGSAPESVQDLLKDGAAGLVRKPYHIHELAAAVQAALKKRASGR